MPGDGERDGGAVRNFPSVKSSGGSSLAPPAGCGRDEICSVDRSGQLWKLPLDVICLASFIDLTGSWGNGGREIGELSKARCIRRSLRHGAIVLAAANGAIMTKVGVNSPQKE